MNYNDYKLFKWNEGYIGYSNSTNLYKDVYINTGTNVKGEWQNVIAVQFVDTGTKIIENINHFIHGPNWGAHYNNTYKIYDNLVKNYIEILNLKKKENIFKSRQFRKLTFINNNTEINNNSSIDELNLQYYNDAIYFSMLDAFSFSNSGHNLSDFLNRVYYVVKNNLKHILIYKGYKNTHNFKLLTLLLPADCLFYELEFNSIYKFNNIVVIYPVTMNILLHEPLICELRNRIINDWSKNLSHLKNKKIILMKTHRNSNVMLKRTQFNCEQFLKELEKKGYIYIIPENLDVFELSVYLLFANTIVYSTGSILYTNKILFNYTAKLVYIDIGIHGACVDPKLLEKSLTIKTDVSVKNYRELLHNF
jgi:hypothetical protein